ncbi:MAG: hypothetical protein LBS63_03825 [Prevotellaceae bacterium]|nr:hypothetical protein [Prevotellaceae bacterium]
MALAYIGIAYLIAFTPLFIRYNEQNDPTDDKNLAVRWVFGGLIFAYGILRGYKTYRLIGRT